MFVNRLFLENQPFLAIQQIFYFIFFRLPFCVCFRYFFIILLEAKHTLFGLEIIFILFWSIYSHFIIRWNFNIVTKIYLFDDTIRNFCHFFSQMSFQLVSPNKLSSVYMSPVFILLLKELFSFNTSWTKSISSFCFFLFSCSIVYYIKFLFEIEELIVLFHCFYFFYCFSILNLWFNVAMFNFFMFERLK